MLVGSHSCLRHPQEPDQEIHPTISSMPACYMYIRTGRTRSVQKTLRRASRPFMPSRRLPKCLPQPSSQNCLRVYQRLHKGVSFGNQNLAQPCSLNSILQGLITYALNHSLNGLNIPEHTSFISERPRERTNFIGESTVVRSIII